MATYHTEVEFGTVCPICYEVLTESKRFPDCLHSFCKSCLISYIASATVKKTEIACPVCRHECAITQNESYRDWVERLPSMDNIQDDKGRVDPPEEKDSADVSKLCDVCLRLKSTSGGEFWCIDCYDRLCRKCCDIHNSIKSSMGHEVKDISEMPSSKMLKNNLYCEVHSDRKFEAFCYDHQQPCCLMCATIAHRKCDKVTTLEECAKSVKIADVNALLEKFQAMQEVCEQKQKNEKDSQLDFKSDCSQKANDIRGKAEKIILHVQEREREILRDLSDIEKTQNEKFEENIKWFDKAKESIFQRMESLTAVKSSNLVDTFLETTKCRKTLTSLNDDLAKLNCEEEKVSVSVNIDSTVVNFVNIFKSFGTCRLHGEGKINYLEAMLESISRIPCECAVTDLEVLDENHLLVSSQTEKSVYICDNKGTLKARLHLDGELWAISKWGDKFAVVNREKNSVQILNVSTAPPNCVLERSISLNHNPSGVAENGENIIVLCDRAMLEISKTGTITELFKTDRSCAYGFCHATRDVILYTSPNDSGLLYGVKNTANFQSLFAKKCTDVSHPVGIATDVNSNIYVVGYSSSSLAQLKADGTFVRTLIRKAVSSPYGVRIIRDTQSMKLFLACNRYICVYSFTHTE